MDTDFSYQIISPEMFRQSFVGLFIFLYLLILAGCSKSPPVASPTFDMKPFPTTIPVIKSSVTQPYTPTPLPTSTHTPSATPQPTSTALPSSTPEPSVGVLPGSAPVGTVILAEGVWRCPDSTTGAIYVGSEKSNKFHRLNCEWAMKIKAANRICFSSREAALAYGYVPCGVCKP
jgi:hypothetical protein